MKRPLRMDEIERYALQGALVIITFVLVITGILVASGCAGRVFVEKTNNFYILDNDLGDVGVKGVDERISEIEKELMGD